MGDDAESDDEKARDCREAAGVASESVKQMTVTAVSAVGAAAGTFAGLGPAVGAVLGAGTARMGLAAWATLSTRWADKRRERFARALDERIAAEDVPPEGDPAREEFTKTVWQAYTRMMSALDDDAVEPLARLVAIYGDGRKPDAFFVGMGRILEATVASDLRVLARCSDQIRIYAEALPSSPDATDAVCFDLAHDPLGAPVIDMAWPHHWHFGHQTPFPIRDPDADRWSTVYKVIVREGLVQRTEAAMVYDAPRTCYTATFATLNMIARVLHG